MAEIWELIRVHGSSFDYYSPSEHKLYNIVQYLKSKGLTQELKYEEQQSAFISCLLADGWEPFGGIDFFRKKVEQK